MSGVLIIFPSDPLRPRKPDEHFAAEWAAARELGCDTALVDHDALQRQDADAVRRISRPATAIYRGWMLRSEQYAHFAAALAEKDVVMRTTAGQYRQAHELPGWYDALRTHTPESTWTDGADRADFQRCLAKLGDGPAVLRDYTKSMKHYWHEAAYLPDVSDVDSAWRVAGRFLELRDEDFTGGFVVRRFEKFTSTEARTWWIDGQCALVGPHPDTTDFPGDVDTSALTSVIPALDLPFVTVDLARRDDGQWRVVELGDGQVSDRPPVIPPETLLAATLVLDS